MHTTQRPTRPESSTAMKNVTAKPTPRPLRANRKGSDLSNQSQTDLGTIDIAALAQIYNSPTSAIAHEELLEQARQALMKYELAEVDLEIATDSLARSMHMLLEQHGLKKLTPEQMATLEKDVIAWCCLSTNPQKTNAHNNEQSKK